FVMPLCFNLMLSLEANSGVIPFQGPYQLQRVSSAPDHFQYIKIGASVANPSTHTMFKWSYLPGMTNMGTPSLSLVNGTDVIVLPKVSIENKNEEEGLNCQVLL